MQIKDRILIIIAEAIILLVVSSLFQLFLNLGTEAYIYNQGEMLSFQIEEFQLKVAIFRIITYIVIPYIVHFGYLRIFIRKHCIPTYKLHQFYENMFLYITLIILVTTFFALDVRYEVNVFSNSNTYLAIVGIVLLKVFNQKIDKSLL